LSAIHAKKVAVEGISIPRGHGGVRGVEILLFTHPQAEI